MGSSGYTMLDFTGPRSVLSTYLEAQRRAAMVSATGLANESLRRLTEPSVFRITEQLRKATEPQMFKVSESLRKAMEPPVFRAAEAMRLALESWPKVTVAPIVETVLRDDLMRTSRMLPSVMPTVTELLSEGGTWPFARSPMEEASRLAKEASRTLADLSRPAPFEEVLRIRTDIHNLIRRVGEATPAAPKKSDADRLDEAGVVLVTAAWLAVLGCSLVAMSWTLYKVAEEQPAAAVTLGFLFTLLAEELIRQARGDA